MVSYMCSFVLSKSVIICISLTQFKEFFSYTVVDCVWCRLGNTTLRKILATDTFQFLRHSNMDTGLCTFLGTLHTKTSRGILKNLFLFTNKVPEPAINLHSTVKTTDSRTLKLQQKCSKLTQHRKRRDM